MKLTDVCYLGLLFYLEKNIYYRVKHIIDVNEEVELNKKVQIRFHNTIV